MYIYKTLDAYGLNITIRGTFGNTIKNGINKSYKGKNQLTIQIHSDCALVFVAASEEP